MNKIVCICILYYDYTGILFIPCGCVWIIVSELNHVQMSMKVRGQIQSARYHSITASACSLFVCLNCYRFSPSPVLCSSLDTPKTPTLQMQNPRLSPFLPLQSLHLEHPLEGRHCNTLSSFRNNLKNMCLLWRHSNTLLTFRNIKSIYIICILWILQLSNSLS